MTTISLEDQPVKELEGAMKTLLLPLWARAKECHRANPLLVDERARQIVDDLNEEKGFGECFNAMEQELDTYYQLSQIIRAKSLDGEIKAYLQYHPQGAIVNIGAGLDTTFERVDNGALTWYDLDLPEVIALRRQFFHEHSRRKCIAKSVLDHSWIDEIVHPDQGIMFVACGVLFFLQEDEVKRLFGLLVDQFPGSEIAFDTMAPFFLNLGNRMVLKKGNMGDQAVMRWAVRSSKEISTWDTRIRVIDEYPMYSRISLDPTWGLSCMMRMKMINWLKGINILHLQIASSIDQPGIDLPSCIV